MRRTIFIRQPDRRGKQASSRVSTEDDSIRSLRPLLFIIRYTVSEILGRSEITLDDRKIKRLTRETYTRVVKRFMKFARIQVSLSPRDTAFFSFFLPMTQISDGDIGITIVRSRAGRVRGSLPPSHSYRRRPLYFRPLSFSHNLPRLFPRADAAQMHREKSSCLKARRRPSCLHLNCFGLNRGCEHPSPRVPLFFSSAFRSFATSRVKRVGNEGETSLNTLLSCTVTFTSRRNRAPR